MTLAKKATTSPARTFTGESPEALKRRSRLLIKRLRKLYPNAECALNHRTPLELVIATILSAQCTDVRVNKVTPALFARFPTAQDYVDADRSEIEELVRTTGFFRNKAKSIQGAAARVVDEFEGDVPQTMDELLSLPGVARKTANVVLGTAFGIADGVVVDTHVFRLSHRLGWVQAKTPEQVEKQLIALIPQKDWIELSHLLILHGRSVCSARKPDCDNCTLASHCPKIGVSPPASKKVVAKAAKGRPLRERIASQKKRAGTRKKSKARTTKTNRAGAPGAPA